jgi:predicted helicase
VLFESQSYGVNTARDAWCYNASKRAVAENMKRMIDFYNSEVDRFVQDVSRNDGSDPVVEDFVSNDPTKISWGVGLKQGVAKGRQITFASSLVVRSLYRPFTEQWLYFERHCNHSLYRMPSLFPSGVAENLVIIALGAASKKHFSVMISNRVPCYDTIEKGASFPRYIYGEAAQADTDAPQSGLFDQPTAPAARARRDAITDAGLAHFAEAYTGEKISKEDLFYYVYGLLHSPDYRERYADNLAKELPRIPRVKTTADFWAFSKAGHALAELHLNYETVPMYAGAKLDTGNKKLGDADYRVEKMKQPKTGGEKDLTRLVYNTHITVTGIPPEAYDYVINGKPALDWVIERQCVKTDKASGIVNDANDWATETMHNPKYPLELFLRVITVSLETMKIVRALPKLELGLEG